jgi:hypothetical protein
MICNPNGNVVPAYLGQMFLDQTNNLFYQARALDADSWHVVLPNDMAGAFIKIYDFFVGLPRYDPKGDWVSQSLQDSEVIKETMKINGLEILHALRWDTHDGGNVMQVRLLFHHVAKTHIVVGFALSTKAHTMPSGAVVEINDGWIAFSQRQLKDLDRLLVRIALNRTDAAISINGEKVWSGQMDTDDLRPVVALFNTGGGRRPITEGYDRALQRNMDR